MNSLKRFMKRHWVFRNVLAVFLGIFGWYLGAYIAEVKLGLDHPLAFWMPFICVAIFVVPFVLAFVGTPQNKDKD